MYAQYLHFKELPRVVSEKENKSRRAFDAAYERKSVIPKEIWMASLRCV